ncbi:HipA family kinase [Campylobacter concisus]|uniref:HipA family kinase n=1 Tax=Campylobacter concisus TaxID=199 RepID=UPI000D315C6D|nr:HipA family kinase [Campylobacter concisus]
MKKTYILKNRDVDVLEFNVCFEKEMFRGFEKEIAHLINVKILHQDMVPYEIKKSSQNIKESLENWIKNRKIPKNREFVNEILASSGITREDSFMAYINISFGLSLNDCYWVVSGERNYKWSDYNLYSNSFNETLALVAFTSISTRLKELSISPELTTNGMLKKCWHKNEISGKIELYKGSNTKSKEGEYETYCEYYMAQIAKALNLNAIDYDLVAFKKEIVSSCELFTSEKYGYLSIYYCLDKSDIKSDKLSLMKKIEEIYGKEAFEDIMLFDALILNTDRHLGNFGMLIDNESQMLVKAAPIFDNGLSFLNFVAQEKLKNIDNLMDDKISWFELNFDDQAKMFAMPRHIRRLEKLSNFKFQRHELYNLDEDLLRDAENFISKRSQAILNMALITLNKLSQS